MEMSPVVHFEMPYEDKNRVSEFYSKAFGWQPQMLGPEMGNYVVMTTTELDEQTKFPKEPGRINGGLFPKTAENPHPSVVVGVKDIREAMKSVEAAGGKLVGSNGGPAEPVMIPGVGMYISFIDTEGNKLAMLQPRDM